MDVLAGRGELLSTAILAAYMGVPWIDARKVMRTDSRFGCAKPLTDEIRKLADREDPAPRRAGQDSGHAGLHRRRRLGSADHAGPRRLRLQRQPLRRGPGRLRDPDLDRRRGHPHLRSPRRAGRPPRRAPRLRRGRRARGLRREGPASGDHPARRRARHPGDGAQQHGSRGPLHDDLARVRLGPKRHRPRLARPGHRASP